MILEDRVRFAEGLFMLGETFNEPISDVKVEAYFQALLTYDIEAVVMAIQGALRSCKFFPRPVELRELIDGSVEDAAEQAWGALLGEVRRVGYIGTPRLDPRTLRAVNELWGGWRRLCETLPAEGPELVGWIKQFKATYQGVERASERLLTAATVHPSVLAFINGERKRIES